MKHELIKTNTINVIANYFYPVYTGLEINMLNTYAELVKKGWVVNVFTTKNNHLGENNLRTFETIKGIRVKRFSRLTYPFNLITGKSLYSNSNILSLHDFSVTTHLPIYIRVAFHKFFKTKRFTLIFSSHGLFNYDNKIYPGLKMRLRKIVERFLGVALINYCADGIRAVSEKEKQGLINASINTNLIKVIGNGIEDEAYLNIDKLASKEIKQFVMDEKPYLLQLGRMDPVKNFELVI